MKFKRQLTKVGTSHAVLIPADMSRHLELKKKMKIEIEADEENGKIIVDLNSRPKEE